LKAKINDPVAAFDSPAINHARSRKMLDVLLAAGADINARSRWWAGGFGLLDSASPDLAAYAIERGAVLTAHAAARLGMRDELRQIIQDDPSLVNARGGDGQTPLHFASTVGIAEFLLGHGAEINARDIDHESTPAQYMIRDRQEIARFLVEHGSKTDLLMAAALGDRSLAEQHLAADPECIRLRVSDEYFPKINPRSGGTIYQWTLGWYKSAPQIAQEFGHTALAQWLTERSPATLRLVNGCWLHDNAGVERLLSQDPQVVRQLTDSDRRQLAHAARNNDLHAVQLFLRAGLPVDARGQHQATPLHWAAWHGNVEMVEAILGRQPPLEATDADFQGTPLRWAIHGSENGWHRESGRYDAVVQTLLKAGATPPDTITGSAAVRSVLTSARR
jgi:ankyrin repeat protein